MHKSTRLKTNVDRIFDCYCEVSLRIRDTNGNVREKPWIKRRFPDTYRVREVLESVPKFACPCNNLSVDNITQFSFVLTNIDSKWTFGYCRISPSTDTCIVLLSQLPWHETFFRIVAHIGTLYNDSEKQTELLSYLKVLYQCKIPDQPDGQLVIQFDLNGLDKKFVYDVPDHHSLPSIPQDRNLTEYYNAIDIENMITLFASALNERHILVTSKRLDRLSACVQAINTLLYPMHWQHIFISVLPSDLLAYLQAPMPFLIGVPEPTFKKLKLSELGDFVLLLADDNVVQTSMHDDVRNLPTGVANAIRNDLKNQVALGDSVSRAFLKGLVMLIGGYREALEFNDGEKITFNHERFIATRPASFNVFLKKMLELQMFRQFIEGRLEMLNSGQGFNDDFEFEVNLYEEKVASRVNLQYQDWLNDMKTKSSVLLRSLNPSLKSMYRGLKDRSKQAYKDWKIKVNETSQSSSSTATGNLNPSSASQSVPSFFYSRME